MRGVLSNVLAFGKRSRYQEVKAKTTKYLELFVFLDVTNALMANVSYLPNYLIISFVFVPNIVH